MPPLQRPNREKLFVRGRGSRTSSVRGHVAGPLKPKFFYVLHESVKTAVSGYKACHGCTRICIRHSTHQNPIHRESGILVCFLSSVIIRTTLASCISKQPLSFCSPLLPCIPLRYPFMRDKHPIAPPSMTLASNKTMSIC